MADRVFDGGVDEGYLGKCLPIIEIDVIRRYQIGLIRFAVRLSKSRETMILMRRIGPFVC